MYNIYLYDNSFINLICLIYELIKYNIRPDNIKNDFYNHSILDNVIELNILNDDKVIDKIRRYIGNLSFNIIYFVFLSVNENKELIIYYYLLNSLKYKDKIIYQRNLKCVSEALKISKYVKREAHKLKGFVRFKELNNGVLFATIEPVNNVIQILSEHFSKRLKDEFWVIKDNKFNLISIYDKKCYYIFESDEYKLNSKITDEEKIIQDMWKTFYKTTGITQRKNDRCRMNFMPKKYWKNIIEVEGEL